MVRTNEQDVVLAKHRIAELKNAYLTVLSSYIESAKSDTDTTQRAMLAFQQAGTAYFNCAEEFVGNSDLLGAHQSALWAQGFAEDCAEMLKSMPDHFQLLRQGFSRSGNLPQEAAQPGSTAYANMQRMVVKYLSEAEAKSIRKLFEDAQLPVYGFENEAKEFSSRKLQTMLTFAFGVFFVIVLLAISFVQPAPSSFQYTVFRTVLALAGAGVAAVAPSLVEIRLGKLLRAGGALVVFAVLYFLNPALPMAGP